MTAAADSPDAYDLAIIGGGVNGCGIARDAAGRGARVVLFEQGDLAGATSSASTKLIHGGLRYLEHGSFRLVREALVEREILWGMAPHIVRPLRFVLPHTPGRRPVWLLRLGLFLYDHLGGRRHLPPTRSLDLARDPAGAPLRDGPSRAFAYSDCWVDDARLVVLNAVDAAERGAAIRTRTKVVQARRSEDLWTLATRAADGATGHVRARALVNAAGPWVADVSSRITGRNAAAGIRLVQGSHIVVPALFTHDQAYLFQNRDGRIVFAIPYEGAFTLIGTTDRDYVGDPAEVRAGPEEVAYLCAAASEQFRAPVRAPDLVWSFSGVRPLHDDGAGAAQAATRDYVFDLDAPDGLAPLLSIFGGKITTYRRLAEHALARLAPHLPCLNRPPWTARSPLPGGDFPRDGYGAVVDGLRDAYPWLAPDHAARLVRAYGTRAAAILGAAESLADLGGVLGADLTRAEVDHLVAREWARTADDVLWRRSKLGLRFRPAEIAALEAHLARAACAA
ncbi:MAG: glycerol-3-phosphate dehydrogenase [Methylobacterium sp.]|uniref:glycerol-3-phosphate dehydrogenase n=1 Tax=Methylobacterium sp. TaxID=409 RepID=UPI0027156175|nr:glycerol-3-phosphate dehydrogenase [Methylobacterium sp.]MDO9428686.1 glycerol-3-phosphate dehydrogenase [Methylobacterium sp.]